MSGVVCIYLHECLAPYYVYRVAAPRLHETWELWSGAGVSGEKKGWMRGPSSGTRESTQRIISK